MADIVRDPPLRKIIMLKSRKIKQVVKLNTRPYSSHCRDRNKKTAHMISAKFKVKSEVARNRASRISSICLITSIKLNTRILGG